MIRVVVPIVVKNGMKRDFLAAAQPLVDESRKEKGCIEYMLVDSGMEDRLYFIELWETLDDLKVHSQAPHSKKYGEILAPLKTENLPIEIYKVKKEDTILKRRSIRNYSNEFVNTETVERILKAGMYAPSAGNQQGWEFIVIRNRNLLDELAITSPYAAPLTKANIAIAVVGNKDVKYPQNLEQDLAAATENILLQITEEELGGVWLGIAPETDRMENVAKLLGLKSNTFPFAIIPFGHPLKETAPTDRWNPEKVRYID